MVEAQAGGETERSWPLQKHLRRNFFLGVVCGGFLSLRMTLTNDNMVLALFVKRLGASNAVVGMLPALRFGCWLWGWRSQGSCQFEGGRRARKGLPRGKKLLWEEVAN